MGPLSQSREEEGYKEVEPDIWERMGVPCGGYNAAIDQQILDAVRALIESSNSGCSIYCDELAVRLSISREHAELLQYLLAGVRYDEGLPFDYGTSPRGLFVGDMELAERFLSECEAQMAEWMA